MTKTDGAILTRFGFTYPVGSTHQARTYMVDELQTLLDYVPDPSAGRADYMAAVIDENCLGKRSGQTRKLTFKHLSALYGLDPAIPIFRTLRYFWIREHDGQPLLALLCACTRDTLLMSSSFLVRDTTVGGTVSKHMMEVYLEHSHSGRLSPVTLASTARNILATWTMAGYLSGKSNKTRVRAPVTPGATAYALYLGYLLGERAELLFQSRYVKLLDCSPAEAVELAGSAGGRGWLVSKRIGDVIEIRFPDLLTPEERELLGD